MNTWKDEDDAPPLTGKELNHPQGRWQRGGKPLEPNQDKVAFRAALERKARSAGALLSERALAADWLKPEEDAAWAYLQATKEL